MQRDNLSSKDATQALSREVSINGDKYQTRREVISTLFYEELFSDDGLLSLDQIDSILTCLFNYHVEHYENTYGKLKKAAWDSILRLSGGISQTSLDAQKYIIDRLLDELNTQPPQYFYLLPSYLTNEDVLLLFYYKCYKREFIFVAFLLQWCRLLQKNDASWMISEPFSPAWIMRDSCINHNAGSATWLAWAQMEAEQGQVGDYESENTARWIYYKAIKRFPNFGSLCSSYARLELLHHSVQQARDILRKAIQYNDFCIGLLAILEFFCGNINSGDVYCTKQLMLRMEKEKKKSFSALLNLYHCSVLLGKKENIERYHQQLLEMPTYDSSNTFYDEFIQLCQEALI